MRAALAAAVLVLVLAPIAAAASDPVVPLEQQTQMKQILASFGFQALEYVPTKVPPHYIYSSNVVNTTQNLITFVNGANQTNFSASFFSGSAGTCGKGSQVSLTISGVKVYSKGVDVWRCLASGGRVVKMDAHGPGVSREDLGTMIASAKHF